MTGDASAPPLGGPARPPARCGAPAGPATRRAVTDRGVLGDATAVLAARVFSLGAAAVQLPVLTRVLTPAEFGSVALCLVAATYVSLVLGEAPTLAFQRHPGSPAQRDRFGQARTTLLLTALAVGVLGLLVGAAVGHARLVAAALAWGLGLALVRSTSAAWLMWHEPWRYAGSLMASTGVRTTALTALLVGGADPVEAVAAAGALSALVALLTGPRAPFWTSGQRVRPSSLGVDLMLASTALSLLQGLDQIVLGLVSGPAVAGVYAALVTLAGVSVGAVLSIVGAAAYPRILRRWDGGDRAAVRDLVRDDAALCVIVAGSAGAAVVVLGPTALPALLGPAYAHVGAAAAIAQAAGLYAIGQASTWVHVLSESGAVVRNRVAVLVALALALLWTCTRSAGLEGAAFASATALGGYAVWLQAGAGLGARLVVLTAAAYLAAVVPLVTAGWPAAVVPAAVVVLAVHAVRHRVAEVARTVVGTVGVRP